MAKVQGLKKNVTKKNKKEVHESIEKLERDLAERHLDELKSLSLNVPPSPAEVTATPFIDVEKTQRLSKAQKRREKKEEKERERAEMTAAEMEEHKNGPRVLESQKINELLKSRDLMIFPISADGDCLYNSVAHQLKATGRPSKGVSELRSLAASYILSNRDSLMPYITNPETDELLEDADFENYCEKLRTTKCWGGQVEIMALSNALKVPIEVLQATGSPTVHFAESFHEPNLVITYHRHFVSLGEHYNSTQPFVLSEED